MIAVIDVGSHEHDGEASIPGLLERFTPALLIGLDPHPDHHARVWIAGDFTLVAQIRAAAWTHDGNVTFQERGNRSHVLGSSNDTAQCVRLARIIRQLHDDGFRVVVKLDCEGAEYALLNDLADTGVDELVELLLVEWHPPYPNRDAEHLQDRLRCPVEHWGATLEVLS